MNASIHAVLPRPTERIVALALLVAILGTAYGVVEMPWLVAGAVLGAVVVAVAISAPLALVAVMLVVGPFDLSFITGGFKSLFPQLGGLDMNGIRLIAATAGFSAFIMTAPEARNAALSWTGRLYLLFLMYFALSLSFSMDKLEGLRLLMKLAYPFLTFLIVIGLAHTRVQLATLMNCTLIAAILIVFVINPIAVLRGGYEVDYLGFRRVRGLGAHQNPFSFYLMIILFIAYTRFVLRGEWRYLLLCGGLAVWIGLTLTRITFAASILGVLLITVLAAIVAGRYRALFVGVAATVLLAVPVLPPVLERSLGYVPSISELGTLIASPMALYDAINWQGRHLLWAVAWAAFLVSPIIGRGAGSSTAVIREAFPSQYTDVVHNEYLRLATDAGLIGVLLFAAAMVSWLVVAFRAALRGSIFVREFALPAFAGIVAWGLVATTDNPFDYYTSLTQYIGFLVAGAVVATRLEQT